MYWQEICRRESVKFGENIEDIINFAKVQRINVSVFFTLNPDHNMLMSALFYFKDDENVYP